MSWRCQYSVTLVRIGVHQWPTIGKWIKLQPAPELPEVLAKTYILVATLEILIPWVRDGALEFILIINEVPGIAEAISQGTAVSELLLYENHEGFPRMWNFSQD